MQVFAFAANIALDVQAPDILLARAEAQDIVGNAKFGDPARRIYGRFYFPYAVPGIVVVAVIGIDTVGDRPRGIGAKETARLAIEMGIEADQDPVGFRFCIAPDQARDDVGWVFIITAHGDIERLFVVGNLHAGLFAGRGTFYGFELEKGGRRGDVLPNLIVEKTVDTRHFARYTRGRCAAIVCGSRGRNGQRGEQEKQGDKNMDTVQNKDKLHGKELNYCTKVIV